MLRCSQPIGRRFSMLQIQTGCDRTAVSDGVFFFGVLLSKGILMNHLHSFFFVHQLVVPNINSKEYLRVHLGLILRLHTIHVANDFTVSHSLADCIHLRSMSGYISMQVSANWVGNCSIVYSDYIENIDYSVS